jgi:hypothetical protein
MLWMELRLEAEISGFRCLILSVHVPENCSRDFSGHLILLCLLDSLILQWQYFE